METLWAPWRHTYITGEHGTDRPKGVPAELASWPGPDSGCVFCNMLRSVRWAIEQGMDRTEAERAAGILSLGTEVYTCLNAFPYNTGHLMIVPYTHVPRLLDLDRAAATEMIVTAQLMEQTLRSVYGPNGLNLGANIGQAAGAGVADHLHLHMLPRWEGDTNFMTTIAEARVLPESLGVTWSRLREAIHRKQPPLGARAPISHPCTVRD